MKALLKQHVDQIANNEYLVTITGWDEDNNRLFEISETYTKSNMIFAAYKSLCKAVNKVSRFGVKVIDVQSNVPSLVKELNGQKNVNSRLNQMFEDRLKLRQIELNKAYM